MFKLDNVTKRFGSVRAVGPVSIEAATGRTTVLIGPSGCGKSTLLRLMIGLTIPDHGQIEFDGTAMDLDQAAALRQRMGYVIQDGGLFPHLTARQNVTLMARHLRRDEEGIHDRVETLCQLTHFPRDALDRFPTQLSGGQRQRVALMRALMLDPDALLLDEPLAALDPMIRHELQTDLRDIFRTLGKTVVLVTHDIGEAGYFGDDIVLLRDGVIIQQGSLHDFLSKPADDFVDNFIGAQRGIADVLAEACT
ncbi:MAG: ATP-binding cassette domain-containing protein [Rhodospirillaceae bacterium]|jgi:osmoprotectant transport system ATP-binding protein|nr:ATP-binding cassette domain-containing protein [Rhodospirillaceae bacterium]MBT5457252.1 ATP-binding cassette domain-containing protein [Rhodospirillaceae bacterium]